MGNVAHCSLTQQMAKTMTGNPIEPAVSRILQETQLIKN